jgi:hypothetical protein
VHSRRSRFASGVVWPPLPLAVFASHYSTGESACQVWPASAIMRAQICHPSRAGFVIRTCGKTVPECAKAPERANFFIWRWVMQADIRAACGHLGGARRLVPVGCILPPRFSAGKQYLARSGRLSAATTPGEASGLRCTSFGVVGASRPPGQGKVEHSARKPGNQQRFSRPPWREYWLGASLYSRHELLKRAYVRPNKRLRHPRLRH